MNAISQEFHYRNIYIVYFKIYISNFIKNTARLGVLSNFHPPNLKFAMDSFSATIRQFSLARSSPPGLDCLRLRVVNIA